MKINLTRPISIDGPMVIITQRSGVYANAKVG